MNNKKILMIICSILLINYIPLAFGSVTTFEVTMDIISDIELINNKDIGTLSINDVTTFNFLKVNTASNETINITLVPQKGEGNAKYKIICPAGSYCSNGISIDLNQKKEIKLDTVGEYELQIIGEDTGYRNITTQIEVSDYINITRFD